MKKFFSGSRSLHFNTIHLSVLFITFATGFTALVYEVTWHRYLANLLGSQSRATAFILAVFLGGLALGYFLFGRLCRGRPGSKLVQICGLAEAGIGLWALGFPILYSFIWQKVGILPSAQPLASLTDTLISVLLIAPPTILMGGTLPLLTQGLSRNLTHASPLHARIYAVNTAGAFLGCLIAGFFFLPQWGLKQTLLFCGFANILLGLSLFLLGAQMAFRGVETASENKMQNVCTEKEGPSGVISFRRGCLLGFLAGFCSLAMQTVFIRLVGMGMGASEYAFCLIVSVYTLMLASGAWSLSRTSHPRLSVAANQFWVTVGLCAVFLLVPFQNIFFLVIKNLFSEWGPSFYAYYGLSILALGCFLFLPIGFMGRAMPLLFHHVKSSQVQLGQDVGRLYAFNTLGCVVGSLLGGYYLLYFVNLEQIFESCMVIMGGAVLLARPRILGGHPRFQMAIWALFSIGIIFLPDWPREKLSFGFIQNTVPIEQALKFGEDTSGDTSEAIDILSYEDGPNVSAAVAEIHLKNVWNARIPHESRSILINGKTDSITRGVDRKTTRLLAHLPTLLNLADSSRAAVIGFGTGITAGSLGLYPQFEQIDCIEISSAVKNLSHLFGDFNYDITENSKFRWRLGDAYRILGHSRQKFAVIVSEPSNPWVTGVERLYAREFYELIANQLDKGGIYSQWIHLYSISAETFELVLRTLTSVFPHVRLFKNGSDIIFLASKGRLGEESLQSLRQKINLPAIQGDLAEIGLASSEELLALEWPFFVDKGSLFPMQTLEFPRLAFRAGKDHFLNESVSLLDYLNQEKTRLGVSYQTRNLLVENFWEGQSESEKNATLIRIATATCPQKPDRLFRNWDRSSLTCRNAMVGLAVAGILLPDHRLKSEVVTGLRHLRKKPLLRAELSLGEINQMIDLFEEYHSSYLRTTPERLIEISQWCFQGVSMEHFQCRRRLITALIRTGFYDYASKLIQELPVGEATANSRDIGSVLTQMLSESKKTERFPLGS